MYLLSLQSFGWHSRFIGLYQSFHGCAAHARKFGLYPSVNVVGESSMNILYLAIPIAICLGAFFLYSFFWAVKNDQFEDLQMPAFRILFDEKKKETTGEETT